MKIKKIRYSENEGQPNEWVLNEFELDEINLLVGKNASGKTRILNLIAALSSALSRQGVLYDAGYYCIDFESDHNLIHYELKYNKKQIEKELLNINGEPFLTRGIDGSGKMKNFAVENGKTLDFKIPTHQVVVNRYDEYQYPYLKEFNDWANNVRYFNFNTDLGKNILTTTGDDPNIDLLNFKETNKTIEVVKYAFKKFKSPFVKNVVKDFNSLGYNILSMDLEPLNLGELNKGGKLVGIVIQEFDRKGVTDQIQMSMGMFRALAIVIHLAFYELNKIPGTVLIDDIGEGLDYERATKLIKLLMEKASKNEIQLLMSSNDKFVMNNISLEYWQLLNRIGEKVTVYNHKNSSQIFKDFEFTGLNNFDFFSTEFFKEGLKEESNGQ